MHACSRILVSTHANYPSARLTTNAILAFVVGFSKCAFKCAYTHIHACICTVYVVCTSNLSVVRMFLRLVRSEGGEAGCSSYPALVVLVPCHHGVAVNAPVRTPTVRGSCQYIENL